ncbi:MAG: putative transcriptional regulator, TetR family [Gemmatimonadetes bacterium]|nr:putative transcriptional regulator, TetR family [Gemmatimonadota bacterium]
MDTSNTAVRILDAAQELVQTRGFNAFSYRDLAERVGIRTASIHYHFPAKSDLGRALLQRYRGTVADARAQVDAALPGGADAAEKLRRFAAVLEGVLRDGGRICLGGMLAADFATLPHEMQRAVTAFVEDNERWLAQVLVEGRAAGALAFQGDPDVAGTALFAALEGAMLTSRSRGDVEGYHSVSDWLIDNLAAARKG